VAGTVNALNHPFSPAPLGTDLYFQFGDGNETPIVGNFDPPASADGSPPPVPATPGLTGAAPAGLVNVVALGGTPQTATVGTAYGQPLQVRVTDALGNPVRGAGVTFAAPAAGAGGTFAGAATVLTDDRGIATAPAFTAGGIAGSYAVTATADDFGTSVAFALTNTPADPPAPPSSPPVFRVLPRAAAGRPLTLTAWVGGASGPAGGSVQFFDVFRGRMRLLGAAALGGGSASLRAVLPAGRHGFRAVYLGDGANAGSLSVLTRLTVRRGPRRQRVRGGLQFGPRQPAQERHQLGAEGF
jgi:hypothetical protein